MGPTTQQDPGETPGSGVKPHDCYPGDKQGERQEEGLWGCKDCPASGHREANWWLCSVGLSWDDVPQTLWTLQMFTGNLANVIISHLHVSAFPYKMWQSCWKVKKAAEGKKVAKMCNEQRRVETWNCACLWKRRWRRWPEGHTSASLTPWLWKSGHILEGGGWNCPEMVFLPCYTVFFYEFQR